MVSGHLRGFRGSGSGIATEAGLGIHDDAYEEQGVPLASV
jgi:hypothetical protein